MEIYLGKISKSLLGCLFSVLLTAPPLFGQNMFRKMMDFDGDGRADFAVTRNVGGAKYWYVWQTTAGFSVFQWGIETDENAAGDFDGDGKFDYAIYRNRFVAPNSRYYAFWIYGSQYGPHAVEWVTNNYLNTVAHQQDYNGDGKTDVAYTFGNSANRTEFFLVFSSGGTIGISSPGGTLVKLGDMTGDGKAENAGFNSGTGIVTIRDFGTGATRTVPFGLAGDEFVAADFDGDGRGDLTVFRPSDGTWWWLRSSDGAINAATFGTTGDVPVPADYDGDGKTDLAVWRAGAPSLYWVYGSQTGVFAFAWGTAGDAVVRY